MPNRTKAELKKHYAEYQGTPEQIKKRSQRNAARRAMVKKHGEAALKGKDIDHTVPLSKGGTNAPSNLKLKTPSANRSFSRNSDHTVKVNKPKKK